MSNSVYPVKEHYDINDLLEIMKILRSENGCDWDKEQDHHSIRMNVLEEAYEVMEAIDSEDRDLLKEELGDLLLQVVFHAQIENESDGFAFSDVCDGICKKLIYRHPHVFGDIKVENSAEVLKNWDMLKSKSKGEEKASQRLESVPKLLPALMRGEKVGKRAGNAGFDFSDKQQVLDSLKSEVAELEAAINDGDDCKIEEELGDVLFSCCNISRFLKQDSEKALTFAINKFISRFKTVEELAEKAGRTIEQMNETELNELWKEAKK